MERQKSLGNYLEDLRGQDVDQKCQLSLCLEELRGTWERQKHRLLQMQPLGLGDLVTPGQQIAVGVEGVVSRVKWQGLGLFAKKDFCKVGFARDLDKEELVSHPNVVNSIGFCEQQKKGSIVMEILDGTLSDVLEKVSFQVEDAFDVVLQVADGMEHLHEIDFTIGDLALGNILIMHPGAHYIAKISDYGGFSKGKCSKAVDIESFGGIAIQILAGLGAEVSIDLGYPEELTTLITECCKKSHEMDFSDISFKLRRIHHDWLK